jgi:lambda repressor-like predicted transcriptional regulator
VNGTRWLATGVVALAVAVGGGAAVAAGGSGNSESDFLGDVAKRLGVSQDKLEGAIEDATIARIDAAVAAGDIPKEDGDRLKEHARSGDMPPILPSFKGLGPVPGPPDRAKAFGPDPLDAAADYLEMDLADVLAALRDGKSLADLAKDKDKSVDGLKQALRDALGKDADAAVDKFVEDNPADGLDLEFRSGDGDRKLGLHIAPADGRMPLPKPHP